MKTPEIPPDEPHRLQSLRALNILDTRREERFDRITRLTRRIFQVPIALLSFADEGRVWFKSTEGAEFSEIPREISFCGHAILHDDVFIIPDASRDERFTDNPGVTGGRVRFYAGCPFSHPDGSRLGTLSILDHQPRTLSNEEIANLRDLAAVVESELCSVFLATQDELTEINNRRGFVNLAEQSLRLCERQGRPATLVFFDLDDFKTINDRFGHEAGDRALRTFAALLKGSFREADIVARLSGDEFVALLPNTSAREAEEVRQRFLTRLHEDRAAPDLFDMRCSSGAVEYDRRRHACLDDLLRDADLMMYRSKQGGESEMSATRS